MCHELVRWMTNEEKSLSVHTAALSLKSLNSKSWELLGHHFLPWTLWWEGWISGWTLLICKWLPSILLDDYTSVNSLRIKSLLPKLQGAVFVKSQMLQVWLTHRGTATTRGPWDPSLCLCEPPAPEPLSLWRRSCCGERPQGWWDTKLGPIAEPPKPWGGAGLFHLGEQGEHSSTPQQGSKASWESNWNTAGQGKSISQGHHPHQTDRLYSTGFVHYNSVRTH